MPVRNTRLLIAHFILIGYFFGGATAWSAPLDLAWVGHSLVPIHTRDLMQAVLDEEGVASSIVIQVAPGGSLRMNWQRPDSGVDSFHQTRNVKDDELPRGLFGKFMFTEAIPVQSQISYAESFTYAQRWVELAAEFRADAEIYLFEGWPAWSWRDGVLWDAFRGQPWLDSVRGQDREAWRSIAAHVTNSTGREITVIPAAQALAIIYFDIAAGRAPAELRWEDMWADDIHFTGSWAGGNANGRHLMAALKLTAIFGLDPRGMTEDVAHPTGDPNQTQYALRTSSPAVKLYLEEVAYALVQSNPYQTLLSDERSPPLPPYDVIASTP